MIKQDDYFTLAKFYFIISGSWSLPTKHWKYQSLAFLAKALHSIYRFLIIFLIMTFTILMSFATYFNISKGFDDTFLAILNVIIYAWNFFVFWFYYFKRREIEEIFNMMNRTFRHRSAPGLTYVSIEPGLKLARKVLNTWQWTVLIAALSYNFIPIVNRQRVLPLPAWYPFDVYVRFRSLLCAFISIYKS